MCVKYVGSVSKENVVRGGCTDVGRATDQKGSSLSQIVLPFRQTLTSQLRNMRFHGRSKSVTPRAGDSHRKVVPSASSKSVVTEKMQPCKKAGPSSTTKKKVLEWTNTMSFAEERDPAAVLDPHVDTRSTMITGKSTKHRRMTNDSDKSIKQKANKASSVKLDASGSSQKTKKQNISAKVGCNRKKLTAGNTWRISSTRVKPKPLILSARNRKTTTTTITRKEKKKPNPRVEEGAIDERRRKKQEGPLHKSTPDVSDSQYHPRRVTKECQPGCPNHRPTERMTPSPRLVCNPKSQNITPSPRSLLTSYDERREPDDDSCLESSQSWDDEKYVLYSETYSTGSESLDTTTYGRRRRNGRYSTFPSCANDTHDEEDEFEQLLSRSCDSPFNHFGGFLDWAFGCFSSRPGRRVEMEGSLSNSLSED